MDMEKINYNEDFPSRKYIYLFIKQTVYYKKKSIGML